MDIPKTGTVCDTCPNEMCICRECRNIGEPSCSVRWLNLCDVENTEEYLTKCRDNYLKDKSIVIQ